MTPDQKFRKAERLCSKKLIEELFRSGRSFYSYPFRLVWVKVENPLPYYAQIAISVQKRIFKKAVDRNLLKRRIREGYRKNKFCLYNGLKQNKTHIVLMLIYSSSDILSASEIEERIIISLNRLKEELYRTVK